MEQIWNYIDLIILLFLLLVGYGFGRAAELRHFRSIIERERATINVPLISMRNIPLEGPVKGMLVSGNMVVATDFFKRFVAGMRMLVGGRLRSFETLLDRARREALLRMKEQAIRAGATMVINVRIETSSITKQSQGRQSTGSVEVLAYGTAIIPG